MAEFDMDCLDAEVVEDLLGMFDHREGSLFRQKYPEHRQTQLSFLAGVLEELKPAHIIETGTHKANFSYFARTLLPEVRVTTFGNNKESQKCVDYLNERFGEEYVEFHCGDSKRLLTAFADEHEGEGSWQFAWVDGGHDYDTCFSDLKNCARLGIPDMCVDDYHRLVKEPVHDFAEEFGYRVVEVSTDIRGIARLERIGDDA